MRSAALLLAVLATTAHADDARRQQLRIAAEGLARDAKAARDPAIYVACGQAYLDFYNHDTKDPNGDEPLYNAGVCFEEGRSAAAALTAYELLGKYFPRSKLMPLATGRRGRLHERIGQLAKAAAFYEEYAKNYAGEKDAVDAISNATYLRRALGDDQKAIANTLFFVRSLSTKRPKEAAQAMFALGPLYARKSADDYVRHARDFIKSYGGEQDLILQAYAGLGESLWNSACAKPDADGLCVRIDRVRTIPIAPRKLKAVAGQKRCGPVTATTVTPLARDPKRIVDAMTALVAAEKLFERLGSTSIASQPALHAGARAKLFLAERAVEDYLALRFPTGLDLTPGTPKAKASLTRFNDYITQKTRLGVIAKDKLTAVVALKDASTSIAALQRLGFMQQSFGLDMMTAEIPVDVRSGEHALEKIDAFCDKMTEVAEPLLEHASKDYDLCIAKAGQLGIDDKVAQSCARERGALGPTTFAVATEMIPDLPVVLPVVDEDPVRPTSKHPQAVRDALAKLWNDYRARVIAPAPCKAHLQKFEALAKQPGNADADYVAGFLQGRCGRPELARAAYTRVLAIDAKHGLAMSNLAELDYRAGARDAAAKQWTAALAANPKLFAPRVGLATLALATLRALPAKAPNRAQLESDIEFHAASGMVVGDDNAAPYVQLGLLAMMRGQLAMARYFLETGRRLDTAAYTELGLTALLAKEGRPVHAYLETAASAPWRVDEVHLALGLHQLALRRYDEATASLAKVRIASYDLLIARGIAARGLAKYADAEKRYTEAIALDASRPEAHFDLGVLWKDYTAARAKTPANAKVAFKKAADAFRRAGTPDAKAFADDCDKAIAMLP